MVQDGTEVEESVGYGRVTDLGGGEDERRGGRDWLTDADEPGA